MLSNGFKNNECDIYTYNKDSENDYVMITLYVDDPLITCSNDKLIKSMKDMLKSRFDMEDMKLANVILEIQISRILALSHLANNIMMTSYLRRFLSIILK